MPIAILMPLITGLLGMIPYITPAATSFINSVVGTLPVLVAAGVDAASFLDSQMAVIRTMMDTHRDPTADEWAALNAAVVSNLSALKAAATN